MAKKNMMQQMAKGLGSLIPTATEQQTPEPATTIEREADDNKPTQKPRTPKEKKPTVTPSAIDGMVAVGARKSASGAKAKVREHTASVRDGLQDGYTRATIIAKAEYIDKLKEIAYQNRSTLKDTIEEAFATYIGYYESKNGEVKIVL